MVSARLRMSAFDEPRDDRLIMTWRRAKEIDDGICCIQEPAVVRRVRVGAHKGIVDDIIEKALGENGRMTRQGRRSEILSEALVSCGSGSPRGYENDGE